MPSVVLVASSYSIVVVGLLVSPSQLPCLSLALSSSGISSSYILVLACLFLLHTVPSLITFYSVFVSCFLAPTPFPQRPCLPHQIRGSYMKLKGVCGGGGGGYPKGPAVTPTNLRERSCWVGVRLVRKGRGGRRGKYGLKVDGLGEVRRRETEGRMWRGNNGVEGKTLQGEVKEKNFHKIWSLGSLLGN